MLVACFENIFIHTSENDYMDICLFVFLYSYWNGLFHLLIQTAKVEKLFSLTTDLRDPNLLKRINQSQFLSLVLIYYK